ncbi:hypothetical protein HA052_24545 [Chromobacterium haemolyticum]|uniref:Uncharacterized protein n=1 Tax=Chromobacterium fluminis TaxID=3044269 RepID=A0ABX0LG33_9NEIS|nr:hypothetical protein [Chromobacterium haemolyticum]NHR08366.1 hypothetical protein [Chromobacterium haemolyticum]
MKELNRIEITKLPKTKLYLDDLYELERLFQKECQSVSFQTKNHKFDNVADIQNSPDEIVSELTITGENPRIQLCFKSYTSDISYSLNNYVAQGLSKDIISYVRKKRRWAHSLFFNIGTTSIAAAAIANLIFYIINHHSSFKEIITPLCIAISLTIFIIIGTRSTFKKFNSIHLKKTKAESHFFHRKKDDMLANLMPQILSTILAFLLGIAATIFLKK